MSLITIIVFIIAPFIAIPFILIGIIKDKKHNIIYSVLLAIIFSIIAYNFNPKTEQDLYRYYFEMEVYYSQINFNDYLGEIFQNTKILFKALQFIFAQIGCFRLLPFFVTFIGYFITFFIITDYSKLKKINPYITIGIIIIFICTFYHINFISGLSQFLSFSIAFLGIYLEYIKGKNKRISSILYIISILVHISAIIVLALRIILIIDFKRIRKYLLAMLIIYACFPMIIYNVINIIPGMQMIAQKINFYMLQGNRNISTIYEYFSLALLITYIVIFYNSKNKLKAEMPNKFIEFIEIILIVNIFSVCYKDIFARVLTLTMLCFNTYFLIYFTYCNKKQLITSLTFIIMFCGALGSVNTNNIIGNDYNNMFNNMHESIFYFLKDREWKINSGS